VKTQQNCRQKGKDNIIAATNIKKQQGYIESKTKSLHKLWKRVLKNTSEVAHCYTTSLRMLFHQLNVHALDRTVDWWLLIKNLTTCWKEKTQNNIHWRKIRSEKTLKTYIETDDKQSSYISWLGEIFKKSLKIPKG
jgi:hypothetical protein